MALVLLRRKPFSPESSDTVSAPGGIDGGWLDAGDKLYSRGPSRWSK